MQTNLSVISRTFSKENGKKLSWFWEKKMFQKNGGDQAEKWSEKMKASRR